MELSYTERIEDDLQLYHGCNQDDIEELYDYLNDPDNFRPFAEGLTTLLQKTGYLGDSDSVADKCDYLAAAFRSINCSIEQETINSWFTGKHRPKIDPSSRRKMYELCFAVGASIQDVRWFFHHVYFDRAFNCHITDEAVYYYSFLHRLTLQEADELICKINEFSGDEGSASSSLNYTILIQNQLHEIDSTTDFLAFMLREKSNFRTWNKKAFENLQSFFAEITGSDTCSQADIDKLKRYLKRLNGSSKTALELNRLDPTLFDSTGLLLREIYHDARENSLGQNIVEYVLDIISGASVFNSTFALSRLLGSPSGIGKDSVVPYVVKVNFPSKKSFSDILGIYTSGERKGCLKADDFRSYDSIRKLLLLFHFYCFWCHEKLGDFADEGYDSADLPLIYRDEAEALLADCGYEPLYAGNPYDWIFLISSVSKDPLACFRDIVGEIVAA